MIPFSQLQQVASEVADPIRARLEATGLAILGTVRADGSPRVSPLAPGTKRCTYPEMSATTSATTKASCGQISLTGNRVAAVGRRFSVTENVSGRPNQTFAAAVTAALIHTGNSASEYCCPRHVLTPYPTSANISWLSAKYGTKNARNVSPNALTGSAPVVR